MMSQGLTNDWQVVFYLEGIREVLEINVEIRTVPTMPPSRRRFTIGRQLMLYPDLMKNLALGHLCHAS